MVRATPDSTTIVFTPISLRAYAILPGITVDDGCTHTTSVLSLDAYSIMSSAISEFTLTWGISLRYTLLECTSRHISDPSISSTTLAAMYSPTVPSAEPGNTVFMSISITGISLYLDSSPIGFKNGYTSTIPLSFVNSLFIRLIIS